MAQNVNLIGVANEVNEAGESSPSKDSSADEAYVEPSQESSAIARKITDGGGCGSGKHSVTKRLQQELLSLMTCSDKGISAFPDSDYMFKWTGTIHGPAATVYEGLVYKLSLEFPSGYPYSPPTVRFVTHCFHPNVDQQSGNICLDILKEKWSALYDVRAILLSIQSLLGEPNNESPLNPQAADLWSNPEAYKRKLNEKTRKTAGTTMTNKV